MNEQIKLIWEKIKGFVAGLNKTVKLVIASILVLVLVVVAVMIIINSTKSYSVLFTGLTSDDMTSVQAYLNNAGVTDYRIESNDTILVPEAREANLKAEILMAGYPTSGFGYTLYLDNVGTFSTESDRKTLYLFDLQNRLGAVVRCFDGVKDATVTIAQGADNSYVLNRENIMEATASVLVTMNGTSKLSTEQATAIRNLISGAVQGLVIDNISIADTAGNNYTAEVTSGTTNATATLKLELEEQVNTKVRNNILQILMPLFGAENISVSVSSTIDLSKVYEDKLEYTEPSWAADGSTGGEGIIGSKVYSNSITRENDSTGGVAGTESNADINIYAESQRTDGTETQVSASGEVIYNVDTTHTQREGAIGVVSDLMVAISINANSNTVDTSSLQSHIARAAGISSDVEKEKISILVATFYDRNQGLQSDTDTSNIPQWMIYAGIAALIALVLIIILIVVLRAKKKKKNAKKRRKQEQFAAPGSPAAMAAAAAANGPILGADIMDVNVERGMQLRKEIRQFTTENSEIAAQTTKTWLRGGDNEGER